MLKIVRYIFLLVHIAFALAFLFACIAPFINPQKFWPASFLGLWFIPLLFVQFLWLIFWLLIKKKYALISVFAILAGSWNISNHFSVSGCFKADSDYDFSLMSFNVDVFGMHSWDRKSYTKESVLQLIKRASPDILCLQEFYTDENNFNTLEILKEIYPYYHFGKTITMQDSHHWGVVTLSKFPIIDKNEIKFDDVTHNTAIATDIVIADDTIRVFNAHLQSIYFEDGDFNDITVLEDGRAIVPALKIVNRLWTAFMIRTYQAELLSSHIEMNPYHGIISGDFNDTPNAYTYRKLSKGRNDAFRQRGCGFSPTYNGPVPLMRIDYILTSKTIETVSYNIPGSSLSDHRAVMGSFSFN